MAVPSPLAITKPAIQLRKPLLAYLSSGRQLGRVFGEEGAKLLSCSRLPTFFRGDSSFRESIPPTSNERGFGYETKHHRLLLFSLWGLPLTNMPLGEALEAVLNRNPSEPFFPFRNFSPVTNEMELRPADEIAATGAARNMDGYSIARALEQRALADARARGFERVVSLCTNAVTRYIALADQGGRLLQEIAYDSFEHEGRRVFADAARHRGAALIEGYLS